MAGVTNISLIGMPGAGKSTVGVLLAKETGRDFLDTDVLIQARQGRTLQQIIAADGLQRFLLLEEQAVLSIAPAGMVVATGGSVVYSAESMRHLKSCGPVVYLRAGLELLERRVTNMATRGVVMAPGDSFADLYGYRCPLYERWADAVVDCEGRSQDEIAARIAASVR
jgi:shikimate kinase